MLPEFARHFTVYALDMLGWGFSDRPLELDCSLPATARRLIDFLDSAGIESCDLLGVSYGGAVAMMIASLAPHRIRHLILVAPVNPWSLQGSGRAARLSSKFIAPAFVRIAPHLRFAYGRVLRPLFGNPQRIRPGTLAGYSAPFKIPGSFEHVIKILRAWPQSLREIAYILPKIAGIPTLLLWGTMDRAVNPASATLLQQQFRIAQLVLLEGVGHLPHEEAPEELVRHVLAFLKG